MGEAEGRQESAGRPDRCGICEFVWLIPDNKGEQIVARYCRHPTEGGRKAVAASDWCEKFEPSEY